MLDHSKHHNVIEESENEESHNRSEADDEAYHQNVKGQQSSLVERDLLHVNVNEQLLQNHTHVEVFTPVSESNKFSFMDRDNIHEYRQQSHQANQLSFAGQSSTYVHEKQSSPRNSQGKRVADIRNTLQIEEHDDKPFSLQNFKVQLGSRNDDASQLGGQSADVYGHVNSGTLRQAVNMSQDHYGISTSNTQSITFNNANASSAHEDLDNNVNLYQTESTTCARLTPNKLMQIDTTRKVIHRHSEEDDDEPSLQSPAPHMVKQIKELTMQEENNARSPDDFAVPTPLCDSDSPNQSPIAPQPEALSITKSEQAEQAPTLQSPLIQPYPVPDSNKNIRQDHLTESPSLPTRTSLGVTHGSNAQQIQVDANLITTGIFNKKDAEESAMMALSQKIDEQIQQKKRILAGNHHRSESKYNHTVRRGLDINVLDYNNTAKLSKGIFALDGLAEEFQNDNIYSDSKLDRDGHAQSVQLRSKSHQGQSRFGPAMSNAPPELQAHIDRMRMRSSFQQNPFAHANSLSPFQKGVSHVQPQFESMYHIQMQQQNQLTAFDAQSQYSAAIKRTNPMAQSITQLHQPLNLTQQHMFMATSKHSQLDGDSQGAILMNQGQTQNANNLQNTGQQYEVLLRERSELMDKIESLQRTVDSQRKYVNELKSQEALLKLQASERADDLDDCKQALQAKDKMVQDLKETLSRQNAQIETLRDELSKSDSKQRDEKKASERKLTEMRELIQKIKDDYNKLILVKDVSNKDKKSSDKTSDLLQLKVKEIYELTVELGSLREENNELKKNVEMQKNDFQERLKEQRERQEVEYNKLVDELEILKIEHAEKLETVQQNNEKQNEQLNQLEKSENLLEEKQNEFSKELNAKQKLIDEKQQLCDLQKEEITQLTNNYRLLNAQLDILQQQLSQNNQRRQSIPSNSNKDSKSTGQSKLQLSSRSRPSNFNNQLTNKTRSSIVSHSPNQNRQLDQSPEIMGTKPGKINENTRKNMIMSSEMQDEIAEDQRANNDDGVYTPVNLSALDDMGMETRRNPIDTEFSRQQQDDTRRSVDYQSSLQIDETNDNANQMNAVTDRQSQNPICYDSLHDNVMQSNNQFSNISQKNGPQNQFIAMESQNSSDWKYKQTNLQTDPTPNQSQFQTTQQPKSKVTMEDHTNVNIQQIENKATRSPMPPSTIYQQFRKNHSKLNTGSSNTRISYTRPSIQSSRQNNTSMNGANSTLQESQDIGSRLITQRRKMKHGLQQSQSTLILQNNDQTVPQGSSTHRGTLASKSSSIHNPLNASRCSGFGQNQGNNMQGNQSIAKQHGYRGSSNGFNQKNSMQASSSNQNLHQPQQMCGTRPSMMIGPHQTKRGLTLAQPQYNMKSNHQNASTKANQEQQNGKLGQSMQQQQSACKTARQFMQRSPIPQSRPQRDALQTSRTSNLRQQQAQNKSLYHQRECQKSAGKIVRQSEKQDGSVSSAHRISRSQRMTESRKKIPSRHEVAAGKTNKLNESYNDYGATQNNNNRSSKLALRDASNRLTDTGRIRFRKQTQEPQDPLESTGVIIEDQHTEEDPQPQKENFWAQKDKSMNPELRDSLMKSEQFTNHHMQESTANYVDSSNCGDQMMDDQPQSQNYQVKGRYHYDEDKQYGAVTGREQTTGLMSSNTTPREAAPAATERVNNQQPYHDYSNELSVGKNNMDEMRMKLQSIQTGKAYLEKKIQEYESRLNLMKVKKDRHSKKMKNM